MAKCTKCLLPDTVPGADIDAGGICACCRQYQTVDHDLEEKLRKEREAVRKKHPACVAAGNTDGYNVRWRPESLSTRVTWLEVSAAALPAHDADDGKGCGVKRLGRQTRVGPDKAVDGDPETRWGAGVGTTQGWLEVDLGDEKRFDTVVIEEGWRRIQRFHLQVKEGDRWRTILEGTAVGPHFVREIVPNSARFLRLNIHKATDVPTVWEFQLLDRFETPR